MCNISFSFLRYFRGNVDFVNSQWYLLIFAPKMVIFFGLIGYCQNKSSTEVDCIKLQEYWQLITQGHCILLTVVSVFNFPVIRALIHFWCVLEEGRLLLLSSWLSSWPKICGTIFLGLISLPHLIKKLKDGFYINKYSF